MLVQPLPTLTVQGFDPFDVFLFLQGFSLLDHQGTLFGSHLLPPPGIQPFTIGLVGPLILHSLHPGFLQNQVLTLDLIALLLRHGVVAPHTLLRLFGLEGLVLTGGFETVHSLVIALTVMGPHFLHTVKGRFLSLPIALLADSILVGVPLFLALPWRIRGPIRSNAGSTRWPTHVIAGMDFSWPLDGPAAVALFGLGSYGNKHD